jgi:hypothetical protein
MLKYGCDSSVAEGSETTAQSYQEAVRGYCESQTQAVKGFEQASLVQRDLNLQCAAPNPATDGCTG